ncbi:hypothetical protein Ac2012v2_005350 [Leucoagaricus gongylophorus]
MTSHSLVSTPGSDPASPNSPVRNCSTSHRLLHLRDTEKWSPVLQLPPLIRQKRTLSVC